MEKFLAESGIDVGIHRQVPVIFTSEAAAFYRILLSHDDSFGAGNFQVVWNEFVMIGERVCNEAQTYMPQVLEESGRIADARHRVDAFPPNPLALILNSGFRRLANSLPSRVICNGAMPGNGCSR